MFFSLRKKYIDHLDQAGIEPTFLLVQSTKLMLQVYNPFSVLNYFIYLLCRCMCVFFGHACTRAC